MKTISLTGGSHSSGSSLQAAPKRVYEPLTDAKQFDKVVHLSEAGMCWKAATKSARSGRHILLIWRIYSGRHIELVPNERIVRAGGRKLEPRQFFDREIRPDRAGFGDKLVFDTPASPPDRPGTSPTAGKRTTGPDAKIFA